MATTSDPAHFLRTTPSLHAGVYYVQEASSMFLEEALRQTADLGRPLRVLDLCAAPGGKSTLLQSLLSPDSLLVSNEVIRNRVSVLRENSIKWGGANTIITSNDPKDFSLLENYFDVSLRRRCALQRQRFVPPRTRSYCRMEPRERPAL